MSLPISLQLWSINKEIEKDFFGTLEKVAKMGYDGVEFAGFQNTEAKELKKVLAHYNLLSVSSHHSTDDLSIRLEETLTYNAELGNGYIALAYSETDTVDQCKVTGEVLAKASEKAKDFGITLCYHNHANEFNQFEGKYALNILFVAAPLVQFESDVYWIHRAGLDPLSYLENYNGRLPLVHLKDAHPTVYQTIEIGQGVLPLGDIAKKAETLGAKHWIVELEHFQTTQLEGVEISLKNLKEQLGR